jgi:FkbM family methyltransferase
MHNSIVKILKGVGLYVYLKRVKDWYTYKFKSKDEYYEAQVKMLNQFNLKDKVCWDIGAADDGAEPYLLAGAKLVLAVEPTSRYFSRLQSKHKDNPKVILIKGAVGDVNERRTLHVCNSEYFSTMDEDQLKLLKKMSPNLEWIGEEKVQMYTLDYLIDKYGMPNYIKIDVEGFEPMVFKGLTKAVELLSFEYNINSLDKIFNCIDRLKSIGNYEFNYTYNFNEELDKNWISAEDIKSKLLSLVGKTIIGDVYAKKR